MPWNPNAPDTIGMEWAPTRAEVATIGAEGSGYAVAWEAESTRQLNSLGAGIQVTSGGEWTIELYHEDDWLAALTDPLQTVSFSPTADQHVSGVWSYPADVAPYYQWVLGAPGAGGNANFMVLLGPSKGMVNGFFSARYAGLSIPAGQRLLSLRLRNDRELNNFLDPNNPNFQEYGFADSTNLVRITSDEVLTSGTGRQTVTYTFRPRNVLASADHAGQLAGLWAGPGSSFGFFFNSYSGPGMQMNSYHQQLVAEYVPERRLAWGTGVASPPSGNASSALVPGPLGDFFTAVSTRGGTPVTITAGERYVTVLRGPHYSNLVPFVARLQVLSGGPPILGYSGGRVRFDANGLPTQRVPLDSVGAPIYTTQGAAASAPVISGDSDPFPLQGVSPVMSALPARQRVTVATDTPVAQVVVPVARANYANPSPLMLRITDDAGAPIGGAFLLSPERWDEIPNAYTMGGRQVKNVRLDLAAAVTLTGGATYWITATCQDSFVLAEVPQPWGVLYLDGFTARTAPTPGFEPNGAADVRNAAILAVSQPAALTNFTATLGLDVLTTPSGCDGRWDVVDLAWDAVVLGDAFLRYEIERQDNPPGGPWERIAHIADPATTTFHDAEARRDRAVSYRARVMRVDGGSSAWATSMALTMTAYCCGIGLISNHGGTGLFFADVEPARKYENLDARGLVIRPTYGRDYQLAFHPAERRGVHFNTNLLVHHGTATDGLQTYDSLRELARADVPHVTVLDELGTRILAAIAVPDLEVNPTRTLQRYYATLDAWEIADQPTVYVVEAPPAPTPVAGTFHMGVHANDRLDRNFFLGFR